MFEKEAEEWVKTKGTDAITCLKENIGWDDVCEQAFKDGAEFGYNKAGKELAKAKEIVKKFSEFVNKEVECDPEYPEYSQELTDLWNELCEQAEQFLKEVGNDS